MVDYRDEIRLGKEVLARTVEAYRLVVGGLMLLISSMALTLGQSAQTGTVWTYQLLPDSRLVDYCPVCGRPDIVVPMQGSFQLRLVGENPLFSTYAVENVSVVGGWDAGQHYKVTGKGTYQIGGEVALVQEMFLDLSIDTGSSTFRCYFTNAIGSPTRLWPMIQASLDQTNGTILQQFHLDLTAAPFREIWFSTLNSLTAGIWNPPTNGERWRPAVLVRTGRAEERRVDA